MGSDRRARGNALEHPGSEPLERELPEADALEQQLPVEVEPDELQPDPERVEPVDDSAYDYDDEGSA